MALSSTSRPSLRGRILSRLPATLTAIGGIAVEKLNGIWTIFPDFGALTTITAPSLLDPSLKQMWVYDPATETYYVMTLAGFGDALYSATSSSSVSVGVGSKTFIVQSGKNFTVGSWVIAYGTDAANYMVGQVTAYVGTSLTANMTSYGGTGTLTSWTIRASSPPGIVGKSAGYAYSWLTDTTSADPTAGKVKANNATFASITEIYISETDADANGIAAVIAAAVSGTSTKKCRVKLYDPVTPANFMEFDATALTDNGAWNTLTVTPRSSGGAFSAALALRADFYPVGDKGDTGVTGATVGVQYTYSTTTADADPGAGVFRFNNVTISSVSAGYFDNTDAGGAAVTAWLDTFDDSTNTAKGTLVVRGVTTPTAWAVFNVTGSVVNGTGYRKVTLTYVSHDGTFTNGNTFAFQFNRAGDKGLDGALAASGTPTVGQFGIWTNATTQKGVSVTGLVKGNGASDPTAASDGTDYLSSTTGAKQGKQTIFIPAAAMVARTTNGAAAGSVELSSNKIMVKTLDFDSTTQEFAQFSVWFPKSWNLGTVTFQPSFSQLTTAAGGVVFGLAGVAVSDGDDLDAALGTAQTSTKTAGTLNKEYQGPESSAITIAGTPAAGDRVVFQINRTVADGSDTLAQDARLHGVRLFFTTNAATDT